MPLAVKKDVLPDPVTIAFFGAWAEMTSPTGNCYTLK
jgi:hypothetical protein